MFSTDLIVNQHLYLLLQKHIEATPEARMAERPDLNHAAWQIGHLAIAYDFGIQNLGGTFELRRWLPMFAPGSTPSGTLSDYPAKAELVETLHRKHQVMQKLASGPVDTQAMAKDNPFEFLRPTLPTTGDLISHLLCGHLGMHLGQFAVWRKVCGI